MYLFCMHRNELRGGRNELVPTNLYFRGQLCLSKTLP